MNKPRFVFIYGTKLWAFAWGPWAKVELEKSGFETYFEAIPDSTIASAEALLPFLRDTVRVGKNDVIIGWSSGATAAMRYAEDNKILGSILFAPSYTDLGMESEKKSGYFTKPWQWEKIKHNQEKIALLYGDEDTEIPQADFEFIAQKLSPSVIKIHKAGHFIGQEFPEFLRYVKDTYQ
jgi:uncharacterized protein